MLLQANDITNLKRKQHYKDSQISPIDIIYKIRCIIVESFKIFKLKILLKKHGYQFIVNYLLLLYDIKSGGV